MFSTRSLDIDSIVSSTHLPALMTKDARLHCARLARTSRWVGWVAMYAGVVQLITCVLLHSR